MLFVGDGRWHLVSLTPGLSCIWAAAGGKDQTTLYDAFIAASVLLGHIYEDCTRLVDNPPPPFVQNRILPVISRLCHPCSGSTIDFHIVDSYHSLSTNRLLYYAKLVDGTDILVKLLNRTAHVLCGPWKSTPALGIREASWWLLCRSHGICWVLFRDLRTFI